MCLVVYLGASAPLPLIAWSSKHPGFHVDAIDEAREQDRVVRDRLGTPFVYYAGSSSHCGCDFQFRQDPEWAKERGRYEVEEVAMRNFRDYLDTALKRVPEVRFFAFWGEYAEDPVERRRLTPDDLLSDDFRFVEGELSKFVRSNMG